MHETEESDGLHCRGVYAYDPLFLAQATAAAAASATDPRLQVSSRLMS